MKGVWGRDGECLGGADQGSTGVGWVELRGEHPSFALAASEPGAENLMMEASNKKGVWGKWTALSL